MSIVDSPKTEKTAKKTKAPKDGDGPKAKKERVKKTTDKTDTPTKSITGTIIKSVQITGPHARLSRSECSHRQLVNLTQSDKHNRDRKRMKNLIFVRCLKWTYSDSAAN